MKSLVRHMFYIVLLYLSMVAVWLLCVWLARHRITSACNVVASGETRQIVFRAEQLWPWTTKCKLLPPYIPRPFVYERGVCHGSMGYAPFLCRQVSMYSELRGEAALLLCDDSGVVQCVVDLPESVFRYLHIQGDGSLVIQR